MDDAIGEFLRERRARIQPADAGLPRYGRRRVPGLRREEVALLAGVSVDYYVRLEQGRGRHVSDSVLDAVARVLRLGPTESDHLRSLARPVLRAAAPEQVVRPGIRTLLDNLGGVPAFVLGRRLDYLAWNAAADAVNGFSALPPGDRNAARHAFLHHGDFYVDQADVALETVAHLRLDAGRHPGDPVLAVLVADLSARSPQFARMWAAHPVKEKTAGTKRLRHPLVGELTFGYETLRGDEDQLLVTYTVEQGSPTDERLRLLLSWTAPVRAAPPPASANRPG